MTNDNLKPEVTNRTKRKKQLPAKFCDPKQIAKKSKVEASVIAKSDQKSVHTENLPSKSNLKSSEAKQINIVVEEIEKNPKIACDETFSKSIATNSALAEVIFCQEILGQYCYTVEHIPILDLNNSKSVQKSIELNEEPDSLSDSNSSKPSEAFLQTISSGMI